MKVLLLGATGLTGNACLKGLLEAPEVTLVVAPVRRASLAHHGKLQQEVVDFEELEAHADLFAVDVIVCCLGTTIKQAGSRERFRQVDFGYVRAVARLAKAGGARAFLLMSAVGASATSPVFYNQVKGELECALEDLDFDYLSIYHPSLLLGNRQQHRVAESAMAKVMPLLNKGLLGPLRQYRAIESDTVAAAMVNEVRTLASEGIEKAKPVVRTYDNIEKLARNP